MFNVKDTEAVIYAMEAAASFFNNVVCGDYSNAVVDFVNAICWARKV